MDDDEDDIDDGDGTFELKHQQQQHDDDDDDYNSDDNKLNETINMAPTAGNNDNDRSNCVEKIDIES